MKVIGVDGLNGSPRTLIVKTNDERTAWLRAESRGITVREVFLLPSAKKTPSEPDRVGVVYLLRCGIYCKIGKSTNPEQRYERLKIQLPDKPELVHEISTNNVDYTERHWHLRFVQQRANGEWFLLSEAEIQEFVRCKRMSVE